MRPRRLLAVALLAGLVLAVAAALLRPARRSAAASNSGPRAQLLRPLDRRPVPTFVGAPVIGQRRVALNRADGYPTFVDVWASWCLPCQEDAPVFAGLARTYAGRVRFVGIDVQDTRSAARAFIRRYRVGYPSIFDPRARLASTLGFDGLPTIVLADRQGRIALRLLGKQGRATLARLLDELVRERSGAAVSDVAPAA